jgi:hypothetical protein
MKDFPTWFPALGNCSKFKHKIQKFDTLSVSSNIDSAPLTIFGNIDSVTLTKYGNIYSITNIWEHWLRAINNIWSIGSAPLTNLYEKNSLGHIGTFCKFLMPMLKKRYIFRYAAGSKNLFFSNNYQSQFGSYQVLKAPYQRPCALFYFIYYRLF